MLRNNKIYIAAGGHPSAAVLNAQVRIGMEEVYGWQRLFRDCGNPAIVSCGFCLLRRESVDQKDISAIRGKDKPPVKDEVMYAKWAGALILFLAFAALAMAFLLFVNVYAALAEFIAATLLMGILWHRMEEKYGK